MLDNLLNKKNSKNKNNEKEISYTRASTIPNDLQRISINYSKTTDVLQKISQSRDMVEAIRTIVEETPDGKMALNIYLRLANQGIKVVWKKNKTGAVVTKYDSEFRDFAANVNANNATGIDGILDQLHRSSIVEGAMAAEVVVSKKVDGIQEIAIIDPVSIKEMVWLPNEQRYAMYQENTEGKKVDLMEGNFFYVPHEPKPGHPEGTLHFAPAVLAVTQELEFQKDSSAVMQRLGFPRYDISIDRKSLVESLSDKSKEGQQKRFEEVFEQVRTAASGLKYNNDFLHFDEVKVETIGGSINGSGIDVRAWFEVLEPMIVNSFSLTPVLMGRLKGGSYSLGSVEFKIVTDAIDSMRRGSKRVLEGIFKIWAAVKGYDIYPVVEHNPIDWKKELDKIDADLKNLELNRRYEEYGYISKDDATMRTVGSERADNNRSEGLYEYLHPKAERKSKEDSKNKNQKKEKEISESEGEEKDE